MSRSSQDPKSTGRPRCVVFKQKQVGSRNVFRQKIFPQDINRFWETMNRYSDSPILKILRNRSLRVTEIIYEANSEILKQECKVDSPDTSIGELQRQAHSHREELDSANCGYEESRREQARLHEELALRDKSFLRYSYPKCP